MESNKIPEQIPPSNIEAEIAILGGLLLDPSSIFTVKDILPVQAFTLKSHQLIYRACLDVEKKGQVCDFLSICNFLSDQKLLEIVGGMTFLSKLLTSTVSAVNLDRYVALILDKYKRRRLIELGHKLTDLGYDTSCDLADLEEQVNLLITDWGIEDKPPIPSPKKIKVCFKRSFANENHQEKSELSLSSEVESIAEVSDLVGDLVNEAFNYKIYPSDI